jgi:RNA polymerase sigma factor (sigma-70 family)
MCIAHWLEVESPDVFACAQAGCETCLEALLERHARLVHGVLRRQWRGEVACTDLLQEGRTGLWQAVMHFDPHRGIAFSTYAWHAIERRMWRAVRKDNRQRERDEVWMRTRFASAWLEPPDPLSMAEQVLWWETVCATLAEMVTRLPEPLQEVVFVFYGLDGGPPRSLAAIGRWYGVTGETVRLWRNEALVQLRMPLYSSPLRQLCAEDSRAAYARAQALNGTWLGRRRRRKVR